jgi:hypothetical protein
MEIVGPQIARGEVAAGHDDIRREGNQAAARAGRRESRIESFARRDVAYRE